MACSNKISSTVIEEPNNLKVEDNEKIFSFKAEILEVLESSILVKPLEGENELNSSDKISIGLSKIEVPFNLVSGQIVEIVYDGMIAESYPAQIFGATNVVLLKDINNEKEALIPMIMVNGQIYYDTGKESTIEARCGVMDGKIEESVESWEKPIKDNQSNFGIGYEYQYGIEGTIDVVIDGKWVIFEVREGDGSTIQYNGKWYDKSKLSEDTLDWLELSDEERMLSSYFPPEFVENDICDLDNIQEDWGVVLEAQNVTSKGLTLVCHQSCLEEECELSTGSYFVIQKLEDEGFVDIPFAPQDYDIAWTMEAWIIAMDSTTSWDVDWEWIYGQLPSGEYRLGKEIMKFNGPGDYETEMIYAHFTIE